MDRNIHFYVYLTLYIVQLADNGHETVMTGMIIPWLTCPLYDFVCISSDRSAFRILHVVY